MRQYGIIIPQQKTPRIQDQVGRGFEQPGLVEGVPGHGRELEPDDL